MQMKCPNCGSTDTFTDDTDGDGKKLDPINWCQKCGYGWPVKKQDENKMQKKTLTELLKTQVEYNFTEAPEDTKRFIVGTARAMAITFLKQFKEEIEQSPTRDMGEIDYKSAQSDLIMQILSYTGEVEAIGRGGRQVSRVEVLCP